MAVSIWLCSAAQWTRIIAESFGISMETHIFGCIFSEMYSPQRAGQRTPPNDQRPTRLSLIGYTLVLTTSICNSMQKQPQMHLNISPTCFEFVFI